MLLIFLLFASFSYWYLKRGPVPKVPRRVDPIVLLTMSVGLWLVYWIGMLSTTLRVPNNLNSSVYALLNDAPLLILAFALNFSTGTSE